MPSTATRSTGPKNPLAGSTAYLSGPMDFVGSREEERKFGWRTRVSAFLSDLGVTVLDPWEKPEAVGRQNYGMENERSLDEIRNRWTFEPTDEGVEAREKCAWEFWRTLHIDLRMVDKADFLVAYCPTTTYSVGTVHEIVVARNERKPVLFVSPRIPLTELDELREHLKQDPQATALLDRLLSRQPIRPNPEGLPSLWYAPLLGGHSFFDGFGFAQFRQQYGWVLGPLDYREEETPLRRPLLPFLAGLTELPQRYLSGSKKWVSDDDWLLWKGPDSV